MDWTDLIQDRDQWKALVNTIMNLRVLKNVGKFYLSTYLSDLSTYLNIYRPIIYLSLFLLLPLGA
jgi:hypothetical protein